MCDTFAILGPYTKNGNTLFGKNSDRETDEVQNVVFVPGKTHPQRSEVKCTYISIPQVEETYDTIISQPFWMWGAEMGTNKYGVSIGNEAVFTNESPNKSGLLGMDMLRLALERSKSAKEALVNIIDLLEAHGQGGNCFYHMNLSYINTWLIVDKNRGFVLETAGEHWVWKEFIDNYNISNALTIEDKYDEISEDAISHAIKKGYCSSEQDFSFKKSYSAKLTRSPFGAIVRRFNKGEVRLNQHQTSICSYAQEKSATIQTVMETLRSHYNNSKIPTYSNKDICWHGTRLLSISQATNSYISENNTDEITSIWTTIGSSPCIQMYKPFFLHRNSQNSFPDGGFGYKFYNKDAVWWQNEILHRLVLENYAERLATYENQRNTLEKQWIDQTDKVIQEGGDVFALSNELHEKGIDLTSQWIERVKNIPAKQKGLHWRYWNKLSKTNKMP